MKRHAFACARLVAALLALTILAIVSAHATSPPSLGPAKYDAIVACLEDGREIVMAPEMRCVDRQKGDHIAEVEGGMPLREKNWDEVCGNAQDPRRLPPDLIKHLSKNSKIAPSGIRILGAVFCDGVDLVGLNLSYSLVLDRSYFGGAFDGRNLRLHGDLSFEYAVIVGSFRLNRARIEGSVYGGASFIKQLRAFDTQVTGSWQHTDSIVFGEAQFVRLTVSGDLNLNGSIFSRLFVQSSRINGTLELNRSEARCAYHINSSSVGYLTSDHAGFGVVKTATGPSGQNAIDYPWWSRSVEGSYVGQLLSSPAVMPVAAEELARIAQLAEEPEAAKRRTVRGCDKTTGSDYMEFYIVDSVVTTALCLTSFAWLGPKGALPDDTHPVTILALNGSRVDGNLIIDLWGNAKTPVALLEPQNPEYLLVRSKHKLEAIGLTAVAAVYDFSDNKRPYFTYLDGLKFDRVHKAQPICTSGTGIMLKSQVELPSVDDVVRWLGKNAAPSSQPFLAFVQAFEKAGGNTTELRVAKQSADLCRHIIGWLPMMEKSYLCSTKPTSDDVLAPAQTTFRSVVSGTADLTATAFQSLLWAVADHGFRPGKVIGPIITVLIVFWLWFWLRLRIVGFAPKSGEKAPWAIGLLFLFDRLIPQYQIRDEHYSIVRYYRRATREEREADRDAKKLPEVTYLGLTIPVCPMDEDGAQRAEKWLVILKVLGVGLTLFLAAAISAMIVH